MFDASALTREAARRYLNGEPSDCLADRVAALKVVDFGMARDRLRASPAPKDSDDACTATDPKP